MLVEFGEKLLKMAANRLNFQVLYPDHCYFFFFAFILANISLSSSLKKHGIRLCKVDISSLVVSFLFILTVCTENQTQESHVSFEIFLAVLPV